MSQFDFPRINFSGRAFINPGTANNNILMPLVTYDPIQVQALLPPRIYLSQDLLMLHRLGALPIPQNQLIAEDGDLRYIEIEPINSRQTFADWAITPLGQSLLDTDYHDLYELVRSKRTGKPLTGHQPANWNYYGGMEFGFRDVVVQSVAISDHRLITSETSECPADVAGLLGATLCMEHELGQTSAVMIDVLPSLSMFSQVFCDRIQLQQNGAVLMSGRPEKGSLRFMNPDRIVNQTGALGASGTFFAVLPLEELAGGMHAPLMSLFRYYGQKSEPLKGIFIRYNLFEVEESQTPDYSILGTEANPAFATIVGSLTPWYEGEMKSIMMGRQLIPVAPFLADKVFAPVIGQVDIQQGRVRLDVLGSIPEERVSSEPPAYETYPVGPLNLMLLTEGKPAISIGVFQVDAQHLSREQLLKTGGILDLPFSVTKELTEDAFAAGRLILYGRSKASVEDEGSEVILMQESDYMIASDQAGLYADQGQDPNEGYVSYGPVKEPCRVCVYQKGRPCTEALPVTIMELTITQSGASTSVNQFLKTTDFRDGQTVVFPTDQAANKMYVFYPGSTKVNSENLLTDLIRTGYFVSLRVLPSPDYGKFLDPSHPHYPTPVTFEVIYQELLHTYDLVYPKASLITPFTEDYFRRGHKFIAHRMAPANWASATYMPSSRDMPRAKWDLFCKWVTDRQASRNGSISS
ncbi:hypothetical protein HNV11_12360 [Spirosoma taeanense]|uniref:Uncharacterized protein n=1 Tax=Spirosoma taeanense TaxID=2735870 RepID=A0A6M5YB60_9BACT|nr:hypothetical protein [Spirosoma taeanense]QJW90112.1 hypothetical protein HNV11_12360 [Spirosoma taeanense]